MFSAIRSIAVCGAGTMGAGIAETAARHGFAVVLFDREEKALVRAEAQVRSELDKSVEKQKISETAAAAILEKLRFSRVLADCSADLVVEAIVEKMEAKTGLFKELYELNGARTMYCSNTSSLSITAMAMVFPEPARLLGLHFFNPATHMKLVEVVETSYSDKATVQTLLQFVKDLGKTPVKCKDAPGFIVNRVARPYYIEALRLAEEGLPVETIDHLMESAGFRMGPFRLMDLIGNDINYAVSCSVYEQLQKPERLLPSPLQQQKLAEGKLGRKSGEGFYTYPA